jgi:hypothetical protein
VSWPTALKTPTKGTLARYGLSLPEWERMATVQAGLCAVCRRLPLSGRLCIDHEHAKGWKRMPDAQRKRYVRGLLCYTCNRFRVGRMNITLAESVAAYFRRPPGQPASTDWAGRDL